MQNPVKATVSLLLALVLAAGLFVGCSKRMEDDEVRRAMETAMVAKYGEAPNITALHHYSSDSFMSNTYYGCWAETQEGYYVWLIVDEDGGGHTVLDSRQCAEIGAALESYFATSALTEDMILVHNLSETFGGETDHRKIIGDVYLNRYDGGDILAFLQTERRERDEIPGYKTYGVYGALRVAILLRDGGGVDTEQFRQWCRQQFAAFPLPLSAVLLRQNAYDDCRRAIGVQDQSVLSGVYTRSVSGSSFDFYTASNWGWSTGAYGSGLVFVRDNTVQLAEGVSASLRAENNLPIDAERIQLTWMDTEYFGAETVVEEGTKGTRYTPGARALCIEVGDLGMDAEQLTLTVDPAVFEDAQASSMLRICTGQEGDVQYGYIAYTQLNDGRMEVRLGSARYEENVWVILTGSRETYTLQQPSSSQPTSA